LQIAAAFSDGATGVAARAPFGARLSALLDALTDALVM
jgi:hypothetical protein